MAPEIVPDMVPDIDPESIDPKSITRSPFSLTAPISGALLFFFLLLRFLRFLRCALGSFGVYADLGPC